VSMERDEDYLRSLLRELTKLPTETEWVEFKHNNDDPQQIGEYISALANSAALIGKQSAYMVWGGGKRQPQYCWNKVQAINKQI